VNDVFPIEQSSYLQRHLLEEEQIAKLKWVESEKAGHDIGIYRARWIWLTVHRKDWVAAMRASGVAGFGSQNDQNK
jgi:hypothetical protein